MLFILVTICRRNKKGRKERRKERKNEEGNKKNISGDLDYAQKLKLLLFRKSMSGNHSSYL